MLTQPLLPPTHTRTHTHTDNHLPADSFWPHVNYFVNPHISFNCCGFVYPGDQIELGEAVGDCQHGSVRNGDECRSHSLATGRWGEGGGAAWDAADSRPGLTYGRRDHVRAPDPARVLNGLPFRFYARRNDNCSSSEAAIRLILHLMAWGAVGFETVISIMAAQRFCAAWQPGGVSFFLFFLSSTALNLTTQVKIKVQKTSWGSVLMTGVIYIVLEWAKIEEAISEAEVKETNRMPGVWYSVSCCYFFLWVFSGRLFVLCMRCLLYCYAVYKPALHCYCGMMLLLSQRLQALKLF